MTAPQNTNFPQKLYLLMDNEPEDVVKWSERGMAFKVVDSDRFALEIIPKYFRHTKITSFQRQLNLYGFRRVTKGEDLGSYYHPKFQRGKPDMVKEIKRMNGKNGVRVPYNAPPAVPRPPTNRPTSVVTRSSQSPVEIPTAQYQSLESIFSDSLSKFDLNDDLLPLERNDLCPTGEWDSLDALLQDADFESIFDDIGS